MSTEAALLAAVLANPDEDTPRLAYADWLDENATTDADRARAEFIRLQIACEGRDDDPDLYDARDRAAELHARYADAWQPTPVDRGPFWEPLRFDWEFRRGFPERPDIDAAAFAEHAPALCAAAPVRELGVELSADAAEALARCAHLRQVRRLELSLREGPSSNAVTQFLGVPQEAPTDYHLDRFLASPHLGGLRELGLRSSSRPAVLDAVAGGAFAALEALALSTGQLTVLAAAGLAHARAIRLRRLTARGGDCGDVGARLLAASPVLSRLEVLDLSACGLTAAGVAALAESPHLGPVWRLALGGNAVGPVGAAALAGSPRLANLRVLDLSETGLGLDGLAAVADSAHLRDLRGLVLSSNRLAAGAGPLLAEGPAFARLRALDLHRSGLGEAGTAHLARAGRLDELRRLDLSSCALGEGGFRALAGGAGLPALTHLDLGRNRGGDAGAAALAAANRFPHLRVLALSHNGITDAGAVALAGSPQLATIEELDLLGNKIGNRGVQALLESPHAGRLHTFRFAQSRLSPAVKAALAKRFESPDLGA